MEQCQCPGRGGLQAEGPARAGGWEWDGAWHLGEEKGRPVAGGLWKVSTDSGRPRSHAFIHLTLPAPGRALVLPHFTDEDMKALGGQTTSPGPHVAELDLSLGSQAMEARSCPAVVRGRPGPPESARALAPGPAQSLLTRQLTGWRLRRSCSPCTAHLRGARLGVEGSGASPRPSPAVGGQGFPIRI